MSFALHVLLLCVVIAFVVGAVTLVLETLYVILYCQILCNCCCYFTRCYRHKESRRLRDPDVMKN